MSRFAVKITKQDFTNKITKEIENHRDFKEGPALSFRSNGIIKWLNRKVEKDLSKVDFDCENFECESNEDHNDSKFLGINELDNGLIFLGCSAGGDWESPVYFIIYWDGKSFRGYIPDKGNHYNRKTMMAYGNDEESDTKEGYKYYNSMDYDFVAMIEDIKGRIEVKDNVVENPKTRVNIEHIRFLKEERKKINELDFDDIEFYEDGKIREFSKKEKEEFRLTGLNNCDFITRFIDDDRK